MSSHSSHSAEKNTGSQVSADYVRPVLARGHKAFLLALFCLAEFMDAFIASSLFPAIRQMQHALDIPDNEITWNFAAYACTFAAFLLISGRVADVYGSKWSFAVGSIIVGLFSLGCGFVENKVVLFVLRAMTGIGAALTVPSALSLIVEWFPEPAEQNRGIAFFGGSGALGNVLGIVIGAVFVQWANWKWIYYFTCMLGVPIGVAAIFLVPQSAPRLHKTSWRRLDLGGVALIAVSVVLFIYAVTSGSATGWGTANVIAPLIVSVFLAIGFFVLEAMLDPHFASLPPRVWFYPNVGILVAIALVPFLWWCSLFFQLMPLMQSAYNWSPIMTAVHFLPIGIASSIIAAISSHFVRYVDPKWTILGGLLLDIVATLLLPFANTSSRYWTFLFPAFLLGTVGTMVIYTNANIAIFMNTPPDIAGTVGAMFNAALQLGVALGFAIMSSITTSTNEKQIAAGLPVGYQGIANGFWFEFALLCLETAALLVFYEVRKTPVVDVEATAQEMTSQLSLSSSVNTEWEVRKGSQY